MIRAVVAQPPGHRLSRKSDLSEALDHKINSCQSEKILFMRCAVYKALKVIAQLGRSKLYHWMQETAYFVYLDISLRRVTEFIVGVGVGSSALGDGRKGNCFAFIIFILFDCVAFTKNASNLAG